MKIYIAHSTAFDFREELYKPIREADISNKYEIILPHETDQFINSKNVIEACDLIVAEVSYPSTGMGIELGWAESMEKKIVCVYKSEEKYSTALKVLSNDFVEYKNAEELIRQIINLIDDFSK